MNYQDWVRKELPKWGASLGFHYTPVEEIENRTARIRIAMEEKAIEALLVVGKMNVYYLSGTTQDGLLLIAQDGRPFLMIKREVERARIESPIKEVVPIQSFRELPSLIQAHCRSFPASLGLELDRLPVKDYFRFRELFPDIRLMDASSIIREARMIKSPFEVNLMRKAGQIGEKVYLEGQKILKEGMTEIDFGGLLESAAKRYGHEGLLRVNSMNYEAYTWHVLSGFTGAIVSQSDSPMGGLGLSPAFPVGGSLKVMTGHEPILVDFGTCFHGYQVDETRMFSVGKMKQKFVDAYKACREIHDMVLEETRPGADGEAIFMKTLRLAGKLGYQENFLGPPGLQTRFIAHGIGLDLNEPPFIALERPTLLEDGMTFAVEPKMVFTGEGCVGIENTVAITKKGYEILTLASPEIFQT